MTTPGFTADASLYATRQRYLTVMNGAGLNSRVVLAGTCTCSDPGCDNPTCTCSCPQQDPCDRCYAISDLCRLRPWLCSCLGGKGRVCDMAPSYQACGTSNAP